jgi:hypothetical protein
MSLAVDFARAQYAHDPPPPETCAACRRELATEYYLAGTHRVCPACAANVQDLVPADNHRAYARGMLWAVPAAVLGMIVYAGFEIVTSIAIGYLAVGVGYLVAKAMRHGSGGRGGRRYQWSAMLLTYAAVAMAFIPMVLVTAARQSAGPKKVTTTTRTTTVHAGPGTAPHYPPVVRSADQQRQADDNDRINPFPAAASAGSNAEIQSNAAATPATSATTVTTQQQHKAEGAQHGIFYSLTLLLGLGLISPFYELTLSLGSGLLGLLILFWGMQTAWRLMASAAIPVDGPFPVAR